MGEVPEIYWKVRSIREQNHNRREAALKIGITQLMEVTGLQDFDCRAILEALRNNRGSDIPAITRLLILWFEEGRKAGK